MLIGWREVGTDAPEFGTLGMSTLACHSNGLGQNLGGLSIAVSTRGPASEPKVKSVKSLSHVRLCDPMDYSLSGSSIRGIFQARVLEWAAISFSRGSSQPRD